MSDIQRWKLAHWLEQADDGLVVTYADHVAALLTQDRQHMEQQAAAVTAAEQRIRGERLVHVINRAAEMDECESRGYAKGVDSARDAVAALDAYYAIEECQGNPLEKGDPEDPDPWKQGHLIERDDALAAIDALTNGQKEA